MHLHDPALWSTTSPTFLGALVAIALVALGLFAAWRLMASSEEAATEPRPRDALDEVVAAIERARAQLRREVESADGTLRAALAPSIEAPLRDLDARVARLVAMARAEHAAAPAELERLELERTRVAQAIAREPDARARALLEAQHRDLEAALALQGSLARNARLAALELERLRTLLESLPARVRELLARRLVAGDESAPADSVARSLELAIASTSQVLDEVL